MLLKCSLSIWKKWLTVATVAVIGAFIFSFTLTSLSVDVSFGSHSKYQSIFQQHVSQPITEDSNDVSTEEEYASCFQGKSLQDGDRFGKVDFNVSGSDVMVFLEIQKTGTTDFGRNLKRNLKVNFNSLMDKNKTWDNRFLRPTSDTEWWMFSRLSTGFLCGLHADWTELHDCVNEKLNELEGKVKKRRYIYITFLRHPVKRFLSEWKHVQRGATWKNITFNCYKKPNPMPLCFEGDNWMNTTLEEFMSCPYNMGVNRQTRMLADLRLVNCYEKWLVANVTPLRLKEIENQMLESAKKNLMEMPYFGILEDRKRSQQLFEYVFPFEFTKRLNQHTVTNISGILPTKKEMHDILSLNHLDLKLYDYATELFERRYNSSSNCFHDVTR